MYENVFNKIIFAFSILYVNGLPQGDILVPPDYGGQQNVPVGPGPLLPNDQTGNPPVYDEAGILLQGNSHDAQFQGNSLYGNDPSPLPPIYNENENNPPVHEETEIFLKGNDVTQNSAILPGILENVGHNANSPGMDMGIPSSEVVSPDGKLDATEILDRNKPEPGFDLTQEEILKFKLWPDGLIPYYIDVTSFSDKVLRDKIRSYLSSVNSLTSLNFVELPSPPSDDSRYVFFINRRGLLGCGDHSILDLTTTGAQHVVLGYHCMSTQGELSEAVLTIAGVPPMHNAPGRDYYIKVNEENIMPDKNYLFRQLDDSEWLFHDLEYDFESAGHYNSYKYSINGRATIEPQDKNAGVTVGETTELSPIDILKLRMLYNFIVRKKLLQAPECHRLFEPGSKFKEYKPSKEVVKPREKPARYMGDTENATPDDGNGQEPKDNVVVPTPNDSHGIVTSAPDDGGQNNDFPDPNYPPPETNIPPNNIPPNNKPPNDIPSNNIPPNDIPAYDISPNDIPPNNVYPNEIAPNEVSTNETPSNDTNNNFIPKYDGPEEGELKPPKNEEDYIFDYIDEGKGPPIINIGPPEALKFTTKKSDLIADMSDFHSVEKQSLSLKSPIQKQKYHVPNEISMLSDFGTSHEANKRYDNVNDIKTKTLNYGQQQNQPRLRHELKFKSAG